MYQIEAIHPVVRQRFMLERVVEALGSRRRYGKVVIVSWRTHVHRARLHDANPKVSLQSRAD